MLGDEVTYHRGTWYNSAKFFDLEYTTVGWVPVLLNWDNTPLDPGPDVRSWFQRVPGQPASQRIVCRGDRVVGFNLLGSRWNHEPLARWIEERRSLDWVLAHLGEAQFDEEFTTPVPRAFRRRRNRAWPDRCKQDSSTPTTTPSRTAQAPRPGSSPPCSPRSTSCSTSVRSRGSASARRLRALARGLGLDNKWTLYGLLYTLAMIAGGVFFLRRHGNSRYERIRTLSVLSVQVVLRLRAAHRDEGLPDSRSTTSAISGRSRSSTSTRR